MRYTVASLVLALLASVLSFATPGLAQDALVPLPVPAPEPPPPPPRCGTRPITIARMQWPSAEILAEIHARLLQSQFDCSVRVVPGDLAATASSMSSNGRPTIAPELWLTRVSDIWNAAVDAQSVRAGAATFSGGDFEGWYIPGYLADAHPELASAAALKPNWAAFSTAGGKPRFISCPPDWSCAVINRNLLKAYGLLDQVDLVEPANRLALDRAIAQAVSRREPFMFYYWQPNALLAQFDFRALDMGAYKPDDFKCLGKRDCADPQPSAFANEPVVIAFADWLASEAPEVAGYLQRASMPFSRMNELLSAQSDSASDPVAAANRFISEHPEIWRSWVGGAGIK